ncbi:xylulokinase [Natronospora cellulosivora (SeqCode)]
MSYLLGIDIGTSGVKCLLLSVEEGNILGTKTENYPISTPKSGWSEQNPEDWWKATKKCIAGLISDTKISAGDIKGLSFSGQMHSSVFLDENMEVIRPAILWSDTRTSEQCQEIYEKAGGLENLIDYVSNPALEGFTAPKILWLKENEPDNFAKLDLVLLPKDYIRYKLCGEINMDVSDGAGTLLMDVEKNDWSDGLLEKLDLSRDILPPLVDSIAVTGKITEDIAKETGLAAGTPVVAGGADNSCGAVGSGIIKEGRVMVSIGTSGVVVAFAPEAAADPGGRIHLFNHSRPNSWYMMGVVLSAGMSFQWMKESLFADDIDFDKLNELAADTNPGSDGVIFLPYLYGERTPHADANARGVYFGIGAEHKQKHFIRSVMEGVAYALKDSLELIKEQGVAIEEIRAIGGGAKSAVWQQILADVFGQEISLLNVEEGPAFGAALIAGVGVDVYDSFEEAESDYIKVVETIAPIEENVKAYEKYYPQYKKLYSSLKENFKDLAEVNN